MGSGKNILNPTRCLMYVLIQGFKYGYLQKQFYHLQYVLMNDTS